MEIKNIDKYFSFEILRRGYDYYKKGKVKEIIKTKNDYIAKVSGTEEYRVTVHLANDNYKMKCTCPYAEESNCKHMAAVLYCLKSDNIPIKSNTIDFEAIEITNFQKFKRSFQKEYNKLFHNRTYIHKNELEEYIDLVNNFAKEGTRHINNNKELAYEIFEYLIMNIDNLDVYDEFREKEKLFSNLFELFKQLLEDEMIFVKLLAFIKIIYTIDSDEYYFSHKENMLNLVYYHIKHKWQASDTLTLLKKLENNKNIYDFEKREIRIKIIYLNYYFIDKEKALKIAEERLDLKEICDFLLEIYNDNKEKQIELLEKIINNNELYKDEEYYNQLLNIYKKNNKEKYLELLKKYLIEYTKIDTYREIKSNYKEKEWDKIKKEFLNSIKNKKLYRDICIEEGYYDNLIETLKNEWIETITSYIELLAKYRPNELLELYKNKLMIEIDRSSCRQHYQKALSYFNNMFKIPNGKNELKKIIKYIRENYKNRSALQEELDFFEETYM